MESKIKSFKDLKVWQQGIALVKEVYEITKDFPKEEQYGLSAQMRRAAISIPSNIAKGFRRRSAKEHKQFLSIALGSCAELETQIIISKELKYTEDTKVQNLITLINNICGMIVNLDKKI
jgi:four helix bundle protein